MKREFFCKHCNTQLTYGLTEKNASPPDNVELNHFSNCCLFIVADVDGKRTAGHQLAFALQQQNTTGMVYQDASDLPLMTSYSGKLNCLHCRNKIGYRGSLMGTYFFLYTEVVQK